MKGWNVIAAALLLVCGWAFIVNPMAHYIGTTLPNAVAARR